MARPDSRVSRRRARTAKPRSAGLRPTGAALWLRGLLLALGALSCACVYAAIAPGPVHEPARIPVRTFPVIWVAAEPEAEAQALAEALAAHLAADPALEVHVVTQAALEPARQAGRIPEGAVVVLIQLSLEEGVDRTWASAPMQSCGFGGCAMYSQTYLSSEPVVSAELVVSVYEGPSAELLQSERIERAMAASDPLVARRDVLAELIGAIQQAVDERDRRERVELYHLAAPELEEAVGWMERGQWERARERLEDERERMSDASREEQGKYFYDLAMARRFAPGDQGLDASAYHAAMQALLRAQELFPRPAHEAAMRRLTRDHEWHEATLAQRAAREHNFALLEGSAMPGSGAPPAPRH